MSKTQPSAESGRILAPPKELADSGALVIGGTAGIGLATARQLAEAGVPRIVLVGRNEARGEQAKSLVEKSGAQVSFVQGNPIDPAAAKSIAAQSEILLNGIDILVCSTAADVKPELFSKIATEDIATIYTDLALPSMHMASTVMPMMRQRRHGVIVNLASDAGKTATPGEAVIGAAKAGIVMFTRTIAIEGKRDGIRANVLTPSLVNETGSTERITSDGFSAKLFAKAAQQAHLGVPVADDIAALAVFLCRPESGRLTGQAISVNGGISAA
ncbi:SDR family NAD(P)-dependent oxidoreductase [Nocardia mikamii]|uniref:SDR family NAD(P)-dependent oxidoreductase n=1 Tax=Nocardia mikamii TaxID=508464 RepID=UPI000AF4D44D|nr:SDR family oxidoreductase [Nocardia mikamii]